MPKEGLLGSGSDGLGTSEKISKAARDARIPCIFNLISLSILCLYNSLIQSYIYIIFFCMRIFVLTCRMSGMNEIDPGLKSSGDALCGKCECSKLQYGHSIDVPSSLIEV